VFHWRELAEAYPEARFILPVRPVMEWAQSYHKRAKREGRSRMIRERLFGKNRPTLDELLEGYIRYVNSVSDYFKDSDRLLVINPFVETDEMLWKVMGDFIGAKPPQGKPFPRKTSPIRMYAKAKSAGQIGHYERPFDPACDPEDWEVIGGNNSW
jgi:hypothetical protein